MLLSEICIRRPVLAAMMSLGLVLFGAIGLGRLPVRELPDVDAPVITVMTVYAGASAAVIETQVTEPLEEALTSIEGIRTLTSESRDQASNITIEFDLSRDVDIAAQDVRDRVARVRGRLPDDIDEPVVAKQDADAQPVMWVALYSGRHSTLELTTLAENVLKDRLQTVAGVSSILLGGAKRFAIRLWLDSQKMAARGVTVLDVQQALNAQSVELPSGRVESWQRELAIETRGELKTPEEYDRLVLKRTARGLVRLRDVGRAAVGVEDERAVARYNAQPAMGLGIIKQSKANTIAVAEGIKRELERLTPLLPEGVKTYIPYDESVYIKRSIDEVWENLWASFLLVIVTIYIFLSDFRSTLVPAVAVPVSVLATFGCLHLLGYSINIVTMLALVLAIGEIVDSAIVVVENIHRHIEEGMRPWDASLAGMREITFAVISTTAALVAVFLPMAFQTSVTGRLFIELAVAISCSVAVSAFVALTLSPMIASRLLRPLDPARARGGLAGVFERGVARITRRYERGLSWSLRHPRRIGALVAASFAASAFLYARLEKEFLPAEDKGRLFCVVIAPEGSTSEYTDRMIRKMEGIIQATPEVDGFFTAVALARGGVGRANEGVAFLRLRDRRERSVQDMVEGPRGLGARFFREVEGAIAIPIIPKAIGRGFGQTFQLVLQHQDLDALNRHATQLSGALQGAGFLLNVRPSFRLDKPQLRVSIDRERAASLGVSVEDISRTLQILFGGLDLSHVTLGGKEYDVIVQLERAARLTPADLDRLYVRGSGGELIQLSSVVTHEVGGGPSAISHYNRLRSATVEATPMGVTLGTAMERAEALLKERLPPGFRYEWAGEAKDLQAAGRDTVFVLLVAVLVIYMVLASQFESLVHPLTVMFTLPLAAAGALGLLWLLAQVNQAGLMLYGWAHYATDPPAAAGILSALVPRIPAMGINLYSQIGMILLLALVTKNGILLVDFANQRAAQGLPARQAMLEAGRVRLRPILMTAVATIVGTAPIVFGFGAGAESRRPLGIATMGGMTFSTFLTLFVIPVVYVAVSESLERWRARLARRPARAGRPAAIPVAPGAAGGDGRRGGA
jgi:hydrophobe/amphiphile efflux-1 (HAE1) family protein